MGKTLAEMTAEIREVNIEKGWRPAGGGPGANTFGDYVALLHSEVSEALEAYRDHRLVDATRYGSAVHESQYARIKPEGVGSELADMLIRLLDMCDALGIVVFDMDMELDDVAGSAYGDHLQGFGENLAWLHEEISDMWAMRSWKTRGNFPPQVLRALVAVARKFGIDLTAEYERKVAYNRTRAFQHGGRTLADN